MANYYYDLQGATLGKPLPDLRKMRSSVQWNFHLGAIDDPGNPGTTILKLLGSNPTTNSGSRPHIWTHVPAATEMEVLVELRTSSTTYDAGGAIIHCSVGDDNRAYEYGARLFAGQKFHLWNYRGDTINEAGQQTASDWLANNLMRIRLRRTATQIMAKYWRAALGEPLSGGTYGDGWIFKDSLDFGVHGTENIPVAQSGIYTNDVRSDVEYTGFAVATNGDTAEFTGTPVSGDARTSGAFPGADFSDDFEGRATGAMPAQWQLGYEAVAGTNTTATVQDLGAPRGHVFRIVATGGGVRRLIRLLDIPPGSYQDIRARIKPPASGNFGSGLACRIEEESADNSGYCAAFGAQEIEFIKFGEGSYQNMGSIAFDYTAATWQWMRAKATGNKFKAKAWSDDEPEPGQWMNILTDTGGFGGTAVLTTGRPGIYAYADGTWEWDDVSAAGSLLALLEGAIAGDTRAGLTNAGGVLTEGVKAGDTQLATQAAFGAITEGVKASDTEGGTGGGTGPGGTTLAPQQTGLGGLEPVFVPAGATGDKFENDGNTVLRVRNESGAPITVTAFAKAACSQGYMDDRTALIPAGQTIDMGPFPRGQFSSPVRVDYSATAGLSVAAVRD